MRKQNSNFRDDRSRVRVFRVPTFSRYLTLLVAALLIAACAQAQAAAPVIIVTATLPATAPVESPGPATLAFVAAGSGPQGPTATPYPTTDFQSENSVPTDTVPQIGRASCRERV